MGRSARWRRGCPNILHPQPRFFEAQKWSDYAKRKVEPMRIDKNGDILLFLHLLRLWSRLSRYPEQLAHRLVEFATMYLTVATDRRKSITRMWTTRDLSI